MNEKKITKQEFTEILYFIRNEVERLKNGNQHAR